LKKYKLLCLLALAGCACISLPGRQPWVRVAPLVLEETTGEYILRVEAFVSPDKARAESKVRELIVLVKHPVYLLEEGPQWKVQAGDFYNRENAEAFKKELQSMGYNDAQVVAVKAEE
jgi:hypothetical protein